MKTVRLSDSLKRDIRREAQKKYESANPERTFPVDKGMELFTEQGYPTKIDSTLQHFKTTWGFNCPTNTVHKLVISAEVVEPSGDDEDGNTYTQKKSYSLHLPDVAVPNVLVRYGDEMRVPVEADNPVFVECMEVEMHNDNRWRSEREYLLKIDTVLDRFATLNQLMKAAPYIKDLVPQDRLQKMHEKDDRSERRKQQAEIADNELSELREVLLEDALLGDE